MAFGLELKRLYDKNRFFEFEFSTLYQLNSFLEDFLANDVVGEKLEIRIWIKEK